MAELEWWMKSPSPFTLIIWLLFTLWITHKIIKKVKYRRWQLLNAFTDGLFTVGLVVLVGDFMWVAACLLRFGMEYPFYPDVFQLLLCLARDAVGAVFCFLLVKHLFDNGFLRFDGHFILATMLNASFLALWFISADSPAWTDWTYALRYNFPLEVVVRSFVLSHVVGRIFLFIMLYSLLRKM